MKLGVVAAAFSLAAVMAASQARAAVQTIQFTVNPGQWNTGGQAGGPFGLSLNPTLTGSVSIDDTLSGATAIVGLDFTTGTKTWTLAELHAPPSTVTFGGPGVISDFLVYLFDGSGLPTAIIGANNSAYLSAGGEGIFCNGCVTSSVSAPIVRVEPVPEPSAWALMIAGLSMAGALLRRQRRAAAPA